MYKRDSLKIVLFSVLLVSGCASKAEKEFWNDISKNSSKFEQLRQTEKVIIGDKKSEQIILLTYLYNKNSKSNEKFILSTYISESEKNSKNYIKKITENGHLPICMRKIPRILLPKELKQIIPRWFDNYIVEFSHTKLKKFRIIITPIKGKDKSIYFYKDMRYIINHKKNNKII